MREKGKRTEKKRRVAEFARMEFSLHCFERELRRISADANATTEERFVHRGGEERGEALDRK